MATYTGLRSIAKRMNWRSPTTVLRRIEALGFLAFMEPRPGGRFVWQTSDELIHTWLVSRCEASRRRYLAAKAARQQRKSLTSQGDSQ